MHVAVKLALLALALYVAFLAFVFTVKLISVLAIVAAVVFTALFLFNLVRRVLADGRTAAGTPNPRSVRPS